MDSRVIARKTLAHNIKRLRKERGWSAEDVARRADVGVGYVRQVEAGYKFFGPHSFGKWAAVFGVPIQELIRPVDIDVVKKILYKVPVLVQISNLFPEVKEGDIVDHLSVPGVEAGMFAYQVVGESMSPAVHGGDYILFTDKQTAQNGDMVVAIVQGTAMIKRLSEGPEGRFLVSDQPGYPSYPEASARIVGRVVGAWRKVL